MPTMTNDQPPPPASDDQPTPDAPTSDASTPEAPTLVVSPPPGGASAPPPPPVPPAPPSDPSGPSPAPPGPVRRLERSPDDRIVAGVCGGLGRYFGVDPVLFRVLFAATSFFGGAGLAAYLLAWALIPDEGAVDPPVDRLIADLRRRKVSFWAVVGVVAIALWTGLFHGWQPWGIGPVVVAAVIIGVALSKRSAPAPDGFPASQPPPPFGPVAPHPDGAPGATVAPAPGAPRWIGDAAAWRAESRQAARERRRRKAPVRWATLGVLWATLGVLALLDADHGIPVVAYGWAVLVVSLGALVVGGLLRRTPWLNLLWVPLALAVVVAFGGSHASLHDGSGDRSLAPQSLAALPAHSRMAFGNQTIDLSGIGPTGDGRVVHVRQAAGTVRLLVPRGRAVTVHARIRFGAVTVDGSDPNGGVAIVRDVVQPGVGGRLTVDVDLAAGQLAIDHVGG